MGGNFILKGFFMALRNWGSCHWCGREIITSERPPSKSKMFYFCSNRCMSEYDKK